MNINIGMQVYPANDPKMGENSRISMLATIYAYLCISDLLSKSEHCIIDAHTPKVTDPNSVLNINSGKIEIFVDGYWLHFTLNKYLYVMYHLLYESMSNNLTLDISR